MSLLNLSDLPQRRVQPPVLPPVVASGDSVAAVAGSVAAVASDVATLEGFVAQFAALGDYADDAAAAVGGVGVGELYRNGSALMIRVA